MSDPVPPEVKPTDPPWLEDHPILREVASFGRTFAGFTFRPRSFARGWLADPSTAMNPLTFMALSAAAVGAAGKVFSALLPDDEAAPSAFVLLGRALGPYLYYAAVALICHALLLPAKTGRRWTSTVAMALFAGGSATAFVLILVRAAAVAMVFTGHATQEGSDINIDSVWLLFVMIVPMVWFYVALGASLAGIHGVKLRWTALVVLIPFFATSFVSAFIPLPVAHLQVKFHRTEGGYNAGLTFTSGSL